MKGPLSLISRIAYAHERPLASSELVLLREGLRCPDPSAAQEAARAYSWASKYFPQVITREDVEALLREGLKDHDNSQGNSDVVRYSIESFANLGSHRSQELVFDVIKSLKQLLETNRHRSNVNFALANIAVNSCEQVVRREVIDILVGSMNSQNYSRSYEAAQGRIPPSLLSVDSCKFLWPANGSIPLYRIQERSCLFNSEISDMTKKVLKSRGIMELTPGPTLISCQAGEEIFSKMTHSLAERFGEAGLSLIPYFSGTSSNDVLIRTLPYVKHEGIFYRILSFEEPLATQSCELTDKELEEEINKVFVPSKVFRFEGNLYLLMSLIPYPEFMRKITQDQLDDFITRLSQSRIHFHLDIGCGTEEEVTNCMMIGGRICYSDGDILRGTLHAENKSKTLTSALLSLIPRLCPF